MTCDEGTELSYAFDSVRLHMQNVPWVRIFKLLYIVYQSGYSCVFKWKEYSFSIYGQYWEY